MNINYVTYFLQEQCNNYYTTVKLSFSNCKFPDSRLKPNWLDSKLSIRELTLDSCSLSEIEDNAFTSDTFVDTSTIILTNNYLISLRKKMFHNLKALERLTIKQKTAIKSAELNSLQEVSDTLTSLQLEEGVINDNKVLQNITGSDTLPNLVELSIRYNSIPEVNAELFQGLPAVKSVYIDNSKVETVSIDTLKPFIHITQFILDNNNINSLPEGLTDPVLGSSKFSLSIHDNPWHCDCSLKWIQDIIISRSIKIPQIPFCKTPQENKDKTFLIADFCSQSNSTTTTRRREQSTVRTTTETTTPQEITVNCANTKRMINHHSREPMSNTLQVRSPFPDFYIKNISETMITLNLPNISGTLIWFSNDTRDSPGCEKIVKTSHVLHNMQSKKAYTICLLGEDKTSISPLNCLPAFAANNLDDESENKPWMRASDKLLVYMFFTMSCVLTFIMGCLMTFLMVRRHPTLLSGSERVMMVKHREVKAIVLPKGVNVSDNKQKLDCDRFYNKSEDGYVTPLPPVDETLPRRVRRVSLQSDKNSYVSQVEATGSQLNSWRVMMERQMFESPPTPPSTDTIPSLSLSVDTENVYQDTN
ncbi:leucine-rich repeat transmembrane protein FLRT3-like [Ceratina calcarata]|uniref:Leucine-rich repeat transmembrane protein FLRT3-like n=1 Tax=Ceratina calcarata TaxID=156304 RepID=A0AAJ7JD80_9HYME|nr:leucine-rich repeat transmembrane protein FLRT3-like [Ceratina calcarata]